MVVFDISLPASPLNALAFAVSLVLAVGQRMRGDITAALLHDLQDIEALCERVIVIDHGTSVYDGTLSGLSFPAEAGAAPIVAAVAASYDVADLSIQEPDIEEVIRELYSRGAR